jgi:aflatoxin B1 aldehyde reductase
VESAVDSARSVAMSYGISGHSAALRWTLFHSILDTQYGDSVIIGASNLEQLEQNLDIIAEGPLPKEVAEKMGSTYSEIADAEIAYHF